ncbi:MAG TPA: SAF domain-containing protein, partial [Acidimicrobiales bacterium]|nr:SAF domain-containing protein [Acidimicrobiales bacterium]
MALEGEAPGTGRVVPIPAVGRSRPALNSRAVLGGLLVAAAAVGTFAAWSGAGRHDLTRYVVAAHDLVAGERLSPADLATEPMELAGALATQRAYTDPGVLVGSVVVSPVARGELVQASSVLRGSAGRYARELSFAVDPSRAVDGSLQPGQSVEVLATYGTGSEAYTVVVVPLAHLVAIDSSTDSLGGRNGLTVTVGLDTGEDALALSNAVNAAQIEVVALSAPAVGPGETPYQS